MESALTGFGGEEIGWRGDQLWIVVTDPAPVGVELLRVTTPRGRTVWLRQDSIEPQPGACGDESAATATATPLHDEDTAAPNP